MNTTQKLRALGVSLVLFLGVGIAEATPAQALSGYGYDHTDPQATGCAGTYARRIFSQNVYSDINGRYMGIMEVWYSTRCGTNWVRMKNSVGGDSVKYIQRNTAPVTYFDTIDSGIGWSWSDQVYAPGVTPVQTSGVINVNNGSDFGGLAVLCDSYCRTI